MLANPRSPFKRAYAKLAVFDIAMVYDTCSFESGVFADGGVADDGTTDNSGAVGNFAVFNSYGAIDGDILADGGILDDDATGDDSAFTDVGFGNPGVATCYTGKIGCVGNDSIFAQPSSISDGNYAVTIDRKHTSELQSRI